VEAEAGAIIVPCSLPASENSQRTQSFRFRQLGDVGGDAPASSRVSSLAAASVLAFRPKRSERGRRRTIVPASVSTQFAPLRSAVWMRDVGVLVTPRVPACLSNATCSSFAMLAFQHDRQRHATILPASPSK
jgi:hypothetical protein